MKPSELPPKYKKAFKQAYKKAGRNPLRYDCIDRNLNWGETLEPVFWADCHRTTEVSKLPSIPKRYKTKVLYEN